MDASTAALAGGVLALAAGALTFLGAVVPIIVRIWQGADPRTRHDFLHLVWSLVWTVLLVLSLAGALVAVYKWHSLRVGSVLVLAYIVLSCLDFGLRQGPLSRGKVAMFVFSVATSVIFLTLISLPLQLAPL